MKSMFTSRRAILAGAASLPALALPAIATNHPDAALFDLERELNAAHLLMEEASALCSKTSDFHEALMPPEPAVMQPPTELAELWKMITGEKFDALPPNHPLRVWHEATADLRSTAWREHSALWKKLQEESGYTAALVQFDDIVEMSCGIGTKIFETPAQTVAGLLVKVKAIDALGWPDPGEAWEFICTDIRTLAGAAVQS